MNWDLIRQGEQTEKDALAFLKAYIKSHGYPPSNREIAEALGIGSPNGARKVLLRLSDKGLVAVTPHVVRGIALTAKGKRAS